VTQEPAAVAAAAGLYSLAVVFAAFVVVALCALCLVEVSSRFDATGGPPKRRRGPLASFSDFPPNPQGEALVLQVRGRLAGLFLRLGASHLQVGTTCRCREGMGRAAFSLMQAVRHAVDPHGYESGVAGAAGTCKARDSARPCVPCPSGRHTRKTTCRSVR
jgi:hypothetical protein